MRKTKCDFDGYEVVGSGGSKIGEVGCLFKLVLRFLGTGYYILPGSSAPWTRAKRPSVPPWMRTL